MLSRAQNTFHHMLNISYTRACAGPFLVYINKTVSDLSASFHITNFIIISCILLHKQFLNMTKMCKICYTEIKIES